MEDASWRDDEGYAFHILEQEDADPEEYRSAVEEIEDQKTRVKLLNRYLLLRVAWFAAWLAAGFFTAHFITPDDAAGEMKFLIHAAFIAAALILSNLVLKIRMTQDP